MIPYQINNKAKSYLLINMKDFKCQKVLSPMTLNHQVFMIKLEIKKIRNNKLQINISKARKYILALFVQRQLWKCKKFLKTYQKYLRRKKRRIG
jgi:hypothetical protein